jgi:hypothetical protein
VDARETTSVITCRSDRSPARVCSPDFDRPSGSVLSGGCAILVALARIAFQGLWSASSKAIWMNSCFPQLELPWDAWFETLLGPAAQHKPASNWDTVKRTNLSRAAQKLSPKPDASQDRACSLAHNLHIERPQIKGISSKLEMEHA